MSGDWFHCRLKPISRAAGRSVVACAAYRTGMTLEDERYAMQRDFSRKNDVVTAFTLAPDSAPAWAHDVTQLWNAVEAKEKRKDAQLAFEWEVALPNELDHAQRENIARTFTGWLVAQYGVAVTTGIHEGGDRGNGLNDHMHVLMTTRPIDADGFAAKKLREFNTRPGTKNPEVDRVREEVADLINAGLEDAGSPERVDHRSFKARGIDRVPTTHLGPGATGYERQGHATERGDINRAIIAERLAWQQEELQPEITATLERELAERFGGEVEPDRPSAVPAPTDPVESVPSRSPPATPYEEAIAAFDAAMRPPITSLRQTGETSRGARLWQQTLELCHHAAEWAAGLGREARNYWQHYIGRGDPERDPADRSRDGPER